MENNSKEVKEVNEVSEVKNVENKKKKVGNKYKSYQKYFWVWYKRNLKNNKLVYINSKDNEWNIQNDIVVKINFLVENGKLGKYGVEYDYVLKCELGNEIESFIEVNGDEYKTKDFEVKSSSNMMLVFSWDKDVKYMVDKKGEFILDDKGNKIVDDKRIKISLELVKQIVK